MLKSTIYLCLMLLVSANSYALTNSTRAENAEFSPIVFIRSEAPDSTGETMPGFCNATFIAKNMMVTAAHCVKLAYISGEKLLGIQTGYYKYITRPTGEVVRIGYVTKSNFSKQVNIELPKSLTDKIAKKGEKVQINPEEDFAIIWWNEATPETDDLIESPVVTPEEHALITKNFSHYKFKVVSINLFSESSLDTKRMGDLDNIKWNNGYIHSKANVRVQEGDSGAPVYVTINDQLKIFAVVKGRASTVFSNWDVYPAVNSHLCTLNKQMPVSMQIKSCL